MHKQAVLTYFCLTCHYLKSSSGSNTHHQTHQGFPESELGWYDDAENTHTRSHSLSLTHTCIHTAMQVSEGKGVSHLSMCPLTLDKDMLAFIDMLA